MAQIVLGVSAEGIYVTDEKHLGLATALSNYALANVPLFVEAPVDAGVHIGLSRDMGQELVIQTILGSSRTVEKTGKHPADFRDMVTSPGGTTTEAALQLEEGRFRSLPLEAVAAAYEKDEPL